MKKLVFNTKVGNDSSPWTRFPPQNWIYVYMLGFDVTFIRGKNRLNRLNSPRQTASGIGKKKTWNKLHKNPRHAASSMLSRPLWKKMKKRIRMLYKNNAINEMLFTIWGCPSSCECHPFSRESLEMVIKVKKGRKLTALPGNIPSKAAVMWADSLILAFANCQTQLR